MSESHVPVDLLNPGQVFACLGLIELAERLQGPVQAGFDWSDPTQTVFRLHLDGSETPPVTAALDFLAAAEVRAIIPANSDLSVASTWSVESRRLEEDEPYPAPEPRTPATLPAELWTEDAAITAQHWSDTTGYKRDNVKFWGGMAGKPGAAVLAEALDLARPHMGSAAAAPFALALPQAGSLRFDWRHEYVPLDAGFSLNKHKHYMRPRGFPLVEVLAAIGLTHARPTRRTKLAYRYGVVGRAPGASSGDALLPPPLVRVALGAPESLPFNLRQFTIQLDWPGRPGQMRCITSVTEESS